MVRKLKESYTNDPNNANQRALRKACEIINDYIDEEGIFLPDVLDRNSETYWQLRDYVKSDWSLDVNAIIEDWIENTEIADERGYDFDWDPRLYIFNVLRFVVGYDYDKAEKLLNLK